jgi:trimethylamine:corrinoid methyltransferase-like protein
MSALVGVANGSTVGMWGGDLQDAMTISYEQLLIDYDIWESAWRVLCGIQVDAETLAPDVIQRVGHDGAFMTDPHTLSRLRHDEGALGQFFVRGEPDAGASMLERAHAHVERVLSEDWRSPVSEAALERIDAYVRKESALNHARRTA